MAQRTRDHGTATPTGARPEDVVSEGAAPKGAGPEDVRGRLVRAAAELLARRA